MKKKVGSKHRARNRNQKLLDRVMLLIFLFVSICGPRARFHKAIQTLKKSETITIIIALKLTKDAEKPHRDKTEKQRVRHSSNTKNSKSGTT